MKYYDKICRCLLFSLLMYSCHENKDAKIISEWIGKEIFFPDQYICSYADKDTTLFTCLDLLKREYKILVYIDSIGCTTCKFRIFEWKKLINEADSLYHGKLSFLFFFATKYKEDIQSTLKRYKMSYPVFFDDAGNINKINKFNANAKYQCFLLDKNNKVIFIGNPTYNYSIWQLYKKTIQNDTIRL